MLRSLFAAALIMGAAASPSSSWVLQTSPTTERLRGMSAASDTVAWASGNKGTVLRTVDGGLTWTPIGDDGFHALSVSPAGGAAWAVGENGRIAALRLPR